MEIIGVIGAMEEEVALLRPKMQGAVASSAAGTQFLTGELFGKRAVLVRCGIGKVHAALCVQAMYHMYGVTKIINTGVAGSLDPNLSVYDVVISKDVVQHDFDVAAFGYGLGHIPGVFTDKGASIFNADASLIEAAAAACAKVAPTRRALVGRIASGDLFVQRKSDKDRVASTFSAACVEMEGAAIGHACYLNNIPFVIIRAISDTAAEEAGDQFLLNVVEAAAQGCAIVEEIFNGN